jgi:hypothetical protein
MKEEIDLTIPDFLRRAPGGGFVYPCSPAGHPASVGMPTPVAATVAALPWPQWSEQELLDAINSDCYTLVERQPMYQELRAREDKRKSLARIAEMKAKQAAAKEA